MEEFEVTKTIKYRGWEVPEDLMEVDDDYRQGFMDGMDWVLDNVKPSFEQPKVIEDKEPNTRVFGILSSPYGSSNRWYVQGEKVLFWSPKQRPIGLVDAFATREEMETDTDWKELDKVYFEAGQFEVGKRP